MEHSIQTSQVLPAQAAQKAEDNLAVQGKSAPCLCTRQPRYSLEVVLKRRMGQLTPPSSPVQFRGDESVVATPLIRIRQHLVSLIDMAENAHCSACFLANLTFLTLGVTAFNMARLQKKASMQVRDNKGRACKLRRHSVLNATQRSDPSSCPGKPWHAGC